MAGIRSRVKRRIKPLRRTLRRLTSALRGRPEFIIVGAAKSGTTSLFKYLAQHPRMAGASRKEIHFFDRDFDKGAYWYQSYFSFVWHDHLRFEASPSYMFFPYVADRIAKFVPEARIIVLLRDPVDRAWSHYQHNVRRMTRESRPFEQAIAEDVMAWKDRGLPGAYILDDRYYSYVRRGIYADQIEPYIRHFGRDRVLVLRSEDMFDAPQLIADQVCDFLDLDRFELADVRPRNVGLYKQPVPMEAELQAFYAPHNERLYELLERGPWWTYPAVTRKSDETEVSNASAAAQR